VALILLYYGNSGLQNPSDDPVLEEVFEYSTFPLRSQNNVLNPIIQPMPMPPTPQLMSLLSKVQQTP
jgi:hypothetical protein